MSEINRPLCPKNHNLKNIYFCRRCAKDYPALNQSIDRFFFCRECNPGVMSAHSHLNQRYSVTQSNFQTPYNQFKAEIQSKNLTSFSRLIVIPPSITDKKEKEKYFSDKIKEIIKNNPPIYLSALKNDPISLQDLNSFKYRKWLADSHFWERPYGKTINSLIETYVQEHFQSAKGDIWDNFNLQFNKNNAAAVDLQKQLEGSKERLNELNREKLLSEFFVKITSCFTNEEIDKILDQYKKKQGQFGNNLSFLLKLGKLKVLELHDKGSQKMKEILKEINITSLQNRQKELYYYYSAISEWKYVEDPTANLQSQIFLDARNRKHFKLQNSRKFIDALSKAIDLGKKSVYYAIRALGYIVQSQYERAQADFAQAERLSYNSDSMENNQLLTRLRRKLSVDEFIKNQQLAKKKTEYIMNLCKHLETDKKYRQLKVCGQELVNRQPQNVAFRVCLLKSLLKLKDTVAARQQLSAIKDLKELPPQEIDEFQRKIELLKAYEQEQLQNLSDAQTKFQNAAKVGRPSATYWYNYGAFLFKHRETRQRNEKALIAINNALQLKQKPEYLQIKYMLLFMMGNLQQAKKIQDKLNDPKFASMKQYVDMNF